MCLIIFAHQVVADFPLLLAANRDEFHDRPTQASGFWPEQPGVLAGRDLQAGGTWMGITRNGRFAAVTNFRDPDATRPAPLSRGRLPLDFLTGRQSPGHYLATVLRDADQYAGFNLLVGDGQVMAYGSNSLGAHSEPQVLAPGIYGLSNASLDTPWPKVELGKARLRLSLADGRTDHDSLASTVSDPELADAAALRGLGMDSGMEQLLSAQFIRAGEYGTRACTTLRISAAGTADWRERGFNEQGEPNGQERFQFELES